MRALVQRFRELPGDDLDALVGTHEAVFVGPAPLRAVAPRAIALGGMPQWYGKRFAPGEGVLHGVNLVRGGAEETLPMTATVDASWLDGRPALVVSYAADAPVPWRWVRDEFRVADAGTLLGLTFTFSPRLRALAAPFTLERR